MAVDPNKEIVGCVYISDDGNAYTLGMRRDHALAAGAIISTTSPGYPRGWKPRHIGLKGGDGIQKTTLVVPAPGDVLFTNNGGGATIGANAFTKTGSTGEKRPHKYASA